MSFKFSDAEETAFIPLAVPEIGGREWEYVKECLDTGWVSSVGPFVDRFESEFAEFVGRKYAVAMSSGTAALHIALLVAGIKPDDEVLVSNLTFIASANAIRYVGAWPVLIDAEPKYWQMDVEKVTHFIKHDCEFTSGVLRNRHTGRAIRGIMPVHILGHPVDMDPILAIAEQYNLIVIEDATESLGAKYEDRNVGQLGDMACFSFNGNKLMTTGGGGMLVTDCQTWAEKARYLTTQAKDDPIEYIHHEIGYNYRLTNVQAALGCAQLAQVPQYVIRKRNIADRYNKAFEDIPGLFPLIEAPWATSAYWMYTTLVDESLFGCRSRQLLQNLAKMNIQTRPLWQPLHASPALKEAFAISCDVSEDIYQRALSLPCSVGLGEQQQQVIAALKMLQEKG